MASINKQSIALDTTVIIQYNCHLWTVFVSVALGVDEALAAEPAAALGGRWKEKRVGLCVTVSPPRCSRRAPCTAPLL